MDATKDRGMGWLPDLPDVRDYTEETPEIKAILAPTGVTASSVASGDLVVADAGKAGRRADAPSATSATTRPAGLAESTMEARPTESSATTRAATPPELPAAVDLRAWASPVEDQGALGSCTAQAGAGVIEYYERKSFGRHLEASRLFLYKATRNLMKARGDSGAYLRSTMGAMVLFGVPPETYWPYTDAAEAYDREPSAFCYAFAQSYRTLLYYRHDPAAVTREAALDRIKAYLAAGHPAMFGFTVYSSIEQAESTGRIPVPFGRERIEGGHAVVAMGYDDALEVANASGGEPSRGALLIRNSWGKGWGEKGYGWLPYAYVLRGLAEDFWSVLKKDWIDTGAFKI